MRLAISDEIACTFAWSLKGGTFHFRVSRYSEKWEPHEYIRTWDSYISLKISQISAKRTPHWIRIRDAHPAGRVFLLANINLTRRAAINPKCKSDSQINVQKRN